MVKKYGLGNLGARVVGSNLLERVILYSLGAAAGRVIFDEGLCLVYTTQAA